MGFLPRQICGFFLDLDKKISSICHMNRVRQTVKIFNSEIWQKYLIIPRVLSKNMSPND